ncbi:unnamed protein product [Parnassius apollo]|uniref:(apollo) hypothetical protein n=1 Tax=Parnassius apollo TaxID=110799 RepID=A0A8S3XHI1_PARAO|nr:unnamed protein product [Parnassius apollo]
MSEDALSRIKLNALDDASMDVNVDDDDIQKVIRQLKELEKYRPEPQPETVIISDSDSSVTEHVELFEENYPVPSVTKSSRTDTIHSNIEPDKLPKFDNTDKPIKATTSQPESDSEEFPTNINLRIQGTVQKLEVSAENLRKIVKEELKSIFDSFKTKIMKQLEVKTKEVLDKFNQISESMSKVESQLKYIQNEVQSNCKKINVLESENTTLRRTQA